jgi:hypothetical protein
VQPIQQIGSLVESITRGYEKPRKSANRMPTSLLIIIYLNKRKIRFASGYPKR